MSIEVVFTSGDISKLERYKALGVPESGEPIEVTDEWWEQKRIQLMQGLQQTQE